MIFLNNLIRDKKFYIYFFLITMCLIFIISILTIFKNINLLILKKENDIESRKLIITTTYDIDYIKEDLKDIKNISKIYNYYDSVNGILKSNDYETNIIISPYYEESKEDKILLPSKLKINNEYIDSKIFLDKKVLFKINDIEYYGIVTGIYNSTSDNIVYISYNDFSNFIDNKQLFNSYIIIADNQKNVSEIISNVSKKNYGIEVLNSKSQKEINILKVIKNMIIFLISFLLIYVYVLLKSIINNILYDSKKFLVLLKTIGYKNSQLFFLFLKDISFLFLISFVISLILVMIVLLIFNLSFISLKDISLLIILIFVIIIFSDIYFLKKIKKTSLIKFLVD